MNTNTNRTWISGIHTLNGYVGYPLEIDKDNFKEIKVVRQQRIKDRTVTYLELNINKLSDDELITSYSQFNALLEQSLREMGVKRRQDFIIRRVDFALNTTERKDFQKNEKLFRLLLACIGMKYKNKNNYETVNLFTQETTSMAIKNSHFQIENYDKTRQSNGFSDFTNRLELRSLRLAPETDIKELFENTWVKRLQKSLSSENVEKTLKTFNVSLAQKYKTDHLKHHTKRRYTTLYSFLLCWQNVIFSSQQMIDLLERLHVKNPLNTRTNFKRSHEIAYIYAKDIKELLFEIKQSINGFFNS